MIPMCRSSAMSLLSLNMQPEFSTSWITLFKALNSKSLKMGEIHGL